MLDRHFIYFPERGVTVTPGEADLTYEDASFTASDGVKLHGWFVPGESDITLVWFHGNGGNLSGRVGHIQLLHSRLGVNVFIFDYRGYGLSEGQPSEKGAYLDAEAALDYLRSRQAIDEKLVLYGHSLGCAVAVEMAVRHQPYAIILESPFTSIRDMVARSYPFLPTRLLVLLIEARYDSLSKIRDVHSPLMVMHGNRDDLVPLDLGRKLFDAANDPKQFYTIEGAGHNDTFLVGGEPYFEAMKSFVQDPGDVEGR